MWKTQQKQEGWREKGESFIVLEIPLFKCLPLNFYAFPFWARRREPSLGVKNIFYANSQLKVLMTLWHSRRNVHSQRYIIHTALLRKFRLQLKSTEALLANSPMFAASFLVSSGWGVSVMRVYSLQCYQVIFHKIFITYNRELNFTRSWITPKESKAGGKNFFWHLFDFDAAFESQKRQTCFSSKKAKTFVSARDLWSKCIWEKNYLMDRGLFISLRRSDEMMNERRSEKFHNGRLCDWKHLKAATKSRRQWRFPYQSWGNEETFVLSLINIFIASSMSLQWQRMEFPARLSLAILFALTSMCI